MICHDFYSRTLFFICSQINRQNKRTNYFRVLHLHPQDGHPACVRTLINPPCRLHIVHRPVGLTNNAWGEPMGCPSERKGEFPPSHPSKCVTEEAQIETLWRHKPLRCYTAADALSYCCRCAVILLPSRCYTAAGEPLYCCRRAFILMLSHVYTAAVAVSMLQHACAGCRRPVITRRSLTPCL